VDEPIECITPQGIKTTRQEHEFDILIYATGFDGAPKASPNMLMVLGPHSARGNITQAISHSVEAETRAPARPVLSKSHQRPTPAQT
jgi:hypothetical protein